MSGKVYKSLKRFERAVFFALTFNLNVKIAWQVEQTVDIRYIQTLLGQNP